MVPGPPHPVPATPPTRCRRPPADPQGSRRQATLAVSRILAIRAGMSLDRTAHRSTALRRDARAGPGAGWPTSASEAARPAIFRPHRGRGRRRARRYLPPVRSFDLDREPAELVSRTASAFPVRPFRIAAYRYRNMVTSRRKPWSASARREPEDARLCHNPRRTGSTAPRLPGTPAARGRTDIIPCGPDSATSTTCPRSGSTDTRWPVSDRSCPGTADRSAGAECRRKKSEPIRQPGCAAPCAPAGPAWPASRPGTLTPARAPAGRG